MTVALDAADNDGGSGVRAIHYSAVGAQTGSATVNGKAASAMISAEGTTTLTYFAVDNAGNREAPRTLTVRIDKTPPRVACSTTPAANASGWNNTDVTIAFSATDELSGTEGTPEASVITTEGAGQAVSRVVVDRAGNTATATGTVSIDKTPPTIATVPTPAPNAAGWNNIEVTVRFTAADSLSGVGTESGPVRVTTEGQNQIVTGTVTDVAGNTASASVTLNIDTTAPVISGLPGPGCSLWPPDHRLVQVAAVTAMDALSGLAPGSLRVGARSNEPENGVADGDTAPDVVIDEGLVQVRAERAGNGSGRLYDLTATAADRAGNVATAGATCVVPRDQGKRAQ